MLRIPGYYELPQAVRDSAMTAVRRMLSSCFIENPSFLDIFIIIGKEGVGQWCYFDICCDFVTLYEEWLFLMIYNVTVLFL